MPTQKTLREILERLYYDEVDYRSNVTIEIVLNEIKSLIKEKLPKKLLADIIKYLGEGYSRETYAIALQVYNSCLTEIEQILEAL